MSQGRKMCGIIAIAMSMMAFTNSFGAAAEAKQPNARMRRESFNCGWQFKLGDFEYSFRKNGICGTAYLPFYDNGSDAVIQDENGWADVVLPHDWALTLPWVDSGEQLGTRGFRAIGFKFPSNSIGWYRKRFAVRQEEEGCRIFLEFDGVYRNARFWVNGCYLGQNDSGFLGKRFEVTDFLHYGKDDNSVTVRVDATVDEGWWYEGAGISRDVRLVVCSPDCVVPETVHIRLKSLTSDVALMSVAYETLDGHVEKRDFKVENPHLWSPEDPYLYELDVKGVKFTYGIRTIRFDPNEGLILNGRRIQVKGVCCHQDHAGVGTAVPDDIMAYRLRLLKEMGVNAYRTSHQPPSPVLLDLCDKMGIMVLDEARLFSSSEEGLDQLRRLIVRDRNHPSVIAWCLGNEEVYLQDTDVGRRIAVRMRELQRRLDPDRVCTYGANNGVSHTGISDAVDVRGINYIRLFDPEKKEARIGNALDGYHARHLGISILGTEEASTLSTRGGESFVTNRLVMADGDWFQNHFESWTLGPEGWMSVYSERKWLAGAFAWTGFDYRGETSWPATVCNFGIMDLCGFPKNNYHYYRARWSDADVLAIYPHANYPRTNFWVNTNCDSVELFVNGKSVGRQRRAPGCHRLSFPVAFQSGTVEARGVRNDRVIINKIQTTGPAVSLKMQADRKKLEADGEDATVINVCAVDAYGREVPNSCAQAYFDVSGEGRMIGLGNGDPISHEPDVCPRNAWMRKLFNGRCQLIVRAGDRPGKLTVRAWLTPCCQTKLDIVLHERRDVP